MYDDTTFFETAGENLFVYDAWKWLESVPTLLCARAWLCRNWYSGKRQIRGFGLSAWN